MVKRHYLTNLNKRQLVTDLKLRSVVAPFSQICVQYCKR